MTFSRRSNWLPATISTPSPPCSRKSSCSGISCNSANKFSTSGDFPDIAVSDKASSIVSADAAEGLQGRWSELDRLSYGGVGGNPPYVRPERGGEVERCHPPLLRTIARFHRRRQKLAGDFGEANLYALFIYRALNDWCRQPNRWGEGAGRMGFVVPLALCGTRENAHCAVCSAPAGAGRSPRSSIWK